MSLDARDIYIRAGQSQTEGFLDLRRVEVCGILFPAAFDGALFTFLACAREADANAGSFKSVKSEHGSVTPDEVVGEVTVDWFHGFDTISKDLSGLPFVKIRAGTSAAPQVQSAERKLIVLVKGTS